MHIDHLRALAPYEHFAALNRSGLRSLESGIREGAAGNEYSRSCACHCLQEIPAIPHGLLLDSAVCKRASHVISLSLITSPRSRSQGFAAIGGGLPCLVGKTHLSGTY